MCESQVEQLLKILAREKEARRKTEEILEQKNREINQVSQYLKDAYDNLTFESGKAIIKPTSFPYLDSLRTAQSRRRSRHHRLASGGDRGH